MGAKDKTLANHISQHAQGDREKERTCAIERERETERETERESIFEVRGVT